MSNKNSNSSATTLSAPYLVIDNGSETEVFLTPVASRSNTIIRSTSPDAHASGNDSPLSTSGEILPAEGGRRNLQRSVIDAGASSGTEIPSTDALRLDKTARSKDHNGKRVVTLSPAQASLRAHRPSAHRTSSSSRVELRSRYHDPSFTCVALQQELVARTRLRRKGPLSNEQTSSGTRASRPSDRKELENLGPSCRSSMESVTRSSPDLRRDFDQLRTYNTDTPLKTCLKKKAQSNPTSPPSENNETFNKSSTRRTLRRVKTVDFEKATKFTRSSPPLELTPKMVAQATTDCTHIFKTDTQARMASLCPGTKASRKSGLANPATTRTDVHVIAIAPSWKADPRDDLNAVDPATPTMQVVESGNRRYEVVWDDVPSEHKIRTHRRRSSACHSLRAVSFTAFRDLHRVNSKLTDWSESWNAPSSTFKPTIVVFPDDDGRTQPLGCAMEGSDDLHVPAPPNSQRTSAGPSRFPSRPASAPMTRNVSAEQLRPGDAFHDVPQQEWSTQLNQSLVVPDPDAQPSRLFGSDRRIGNIQSARKLSNLDDIDVNFRGHRDSVALAHSRLVLSSDFADVVLTRRMSYLGEEKHSLARKYVVNGQPSGKKKMQQLDAQLDVLDAVSETGVRKGTSGPCLDRKSIDEYIEAQARRKQKHICIVD
ncbi:hypothetical protein EK21DRAFT_91582 [Setomelanomma holmii]|uniref:Uncharacterized protein n=1 Tax=Setomelanomma holmii TaxID=210430 RepID=A0A9P4LJP2_9PLEO|nr:hypothetical protein EK21DRAFT_91582 [Setomelanomma holmii]